LALSMGRLAGQEFSPPSLIAFPVRAVFLSWIADVFLRME
jgi:hypothetical protein